jgi:hypothetical protein
VGCGVTVGGFVVDVGKAAQVTLCAVSKGIIVGVDVGGGDKVAVEKYAVAKLTLVTNCG